MYGPRTKSSIANVLASLASRLLTVLLSFVTRTVFLQVFCTEYLGLNALFTDVLSLLSVADLGLGTAMVYSYYRPLAEQDHQRLAALTHFYRTVYRLIAAAVAGFGICLIPVLPLIVNLDSPVPHLTVYYLFALAELAASYLFCSFTAILAADQKSYLTAGIGMAVSVVRMVLQLAAILLFQSYTGYLAAAALGSIGQNLLASRVAVRRYPFLRQRAELSLQEKTAIWRTTGSIFLYKASSLLLNATDNILISVFAGTAAVGLYSNYYLVQTQLAGLFALLFTSLTASIGNLIVTEGARRRYEVFRCEQMVSFLICAVAVPCYVVLVNEFIALWLGDAYLLSRLVVYAMGSILYLGCALQPLWSYREATGLYTRTKWVMAICAAVNLLLSVLLGLWLGTAGILLASALSRVLTYVWYEPMLLFRDYFERRADTFFRQLIQNAALTACLTLCLDRLSQTFPATSWGTWFGKAVVTGSICLITAGSLYGQTEEMSLLLKRLGHSKQSGPPV